jgi:hypothetical protein
LDHAKLAGTTSALHWLIFGKREAGPKREYMSREKGKKLKVEENKRKEMDTVDYATRCSSDHQTSRPTWPKRLIHRHGRAIPPTHLHQNAAHRQILTSPPRVAPGGDLDRACSALGLCFGPITLHLPELTQFSYRLRTVFQKKKKRCGSVEPSPVWNHGPNRFATNPPQPRPSVSQSRKKFPCVAFLILDSTSLFQQVWPGCQFRASLADPLFFETEKTKFSLPKSKMWAV